MDFEWFLKFYEGFGLRKVLDLFKDPFQPFTLAGSCTSLCPRVLRTLLLVRLRLHYIPGFDIVIGLAGCCSLFYIILDWWCMRFFIAYLLAILSVVGNGKCNTEAGIKEAKSGGSTSLVSAYAWNCPAFNSKAAAFAEDSAGTSFEGFWISSPNTPGHGEFRTTRLVLCHVPEDEITSGSLLRSLWTIMGAVHGEAWSPSSSTVVGGWSECWLARSSTLSTYQKPESQEQTKVQKEETGFLLECERSLQWCPCQSDDCIMASFESMVQQHGIYRSKGIWKGFCPCSYAGGIASSTSTAFAHDAGRTWCTLDAPGQSWWISSALHATSCGFIVADATSIYGYASTWCSFRCLTQAGEQCPAETASHREGGQEGGQPLCGVPRVGTCRDEEGRQGKHQRFVGCCPGTWTCQGGTPGSGECQETAMVSVALVSPTIRYQVEGVHSTISDFRGLLSDADARSNRQSPSHSTTCGCGQEKSRGSWYRGGHYCPVGGRHGRDGAQGGWGASTRRECAEDSRGIASGGEQPGRVIGIGRSARTQAEKAAQGSRRGCRGIAWHYRIAKYAAFWQGRCCVTNAYQHLGPSVAYDTPADLLYWSHSILEEPSFLSPWMAIEAAHDLAIEVGAWGPLRCDDFALPSPSKQSKGQIRFADMVEVLVEDAVSGEFHTQTDLPNDLLMIHGPQFCPSSVPDVARGPESHGPAASSSTGQSSATHFLDRRLPNDLPGYVHHLQHLWRDNLLRVPDGQAYKVRTWYLHHVHQRIWTVPREIQLPDNPGGWHHELLTAWRDQLHNDEVLNVAVVFPEVRALQGVLPAHADLLLVQGDPAHAGGVTTVFPPTADAQGSYTWATSLPRHVSGVDILTAVNADVTLQSHGCDLFHGGVVIPTTSVPSHWMQNGHSFVAVFQDLHGDAGNRLSSVIDTTDTTGRVGRAVNDNEDFNAPDAEQAEESSPVASSSFEEEDLRGLHILGLQQPARHCFVRWTTYNCILLDVLRDVGLHRDLAIGFHHVQVPLIDQHVAEEAIILQRVGDIPPGSPDQLVVVDIVFENCNEQRATPPRHVRRLPRFLCRTAFLQQLQLAEICERDRPETSCLIFFNRVHWDHDDDAPREFTHGVYLRVIVLPPRNRDDAAVRIQVCESGGSNPAKRPRRSRSTSPPSMSMPTGSSLLQTSMKVKDAVFQGSLTCSATFPSLAHTNIPAAVHAAANGRAIPPLNSNWIFPLSTTFATCSAIEFPDEGPVQYWTTWYLHHDRYPRNTESRILRLDRFRRHWYHDLRNLWGDAIDHHSAVAIHVVLPTPPRESQPQTVGHILLVQAPRDAIPTLLTALFDHPVQRRIWHIAAFLPTHIAHQHAIDALGIQRWSSSRTCHFQAGTARWLPHEIVAIQPGEHIMVTILPMNTGTMATSMMQVQATLSSSSFSSAPDPGTSVHPSPLTIPRTMPRRFDSLLRERMRDFFERNAVVELEEEGPVMYVWTWFINHQTSRECREPTAVRLTSQDDHWWRGILEPWQGHLQVDAETHVNIISPRPWTDRFRMDTLHLMIEQHPSEPVVAGIITAFMHGPQGDRIHQMAYSLSRWLCTNDLIDVLCIHHLCDVHRCTARAGIPHFEKYIRHDVYSAISIEVPLHLHIVMEILTLQVPLNISFTVLKSVMMWPTFFSVHAQ